jgi:hypothetical protein
MLTTIAARGPYITAARTIGSEDTETLAREVKWTLCISAMKADTARATNGQVSVAPGSVLLSSTVVSKTSSSAISQPVYPISAQSRRVGVDSRPNNAWKRRSISFLRLDGFS